MRGHVRSPSGAAVGIRIPGLDGLRALAVLTVFLGHAGLPFGVGAGTGVTVFFFLSGYLITTLLRREVVRTGRVSIRNFYLRRVLRIFPPMYMFLATASVLTLAGVVAGRLTTYGFIAALSYVTNFVEIWGNYQRLIPGAGLLWSLAIEEHFYLVFPLLFCLMARRLCRRRQAWLLGSLCGLTLIWRCILVFALGDGYNRTYYGSDSRADTLLAGCLLAIALNPVLDQLPPKIDQALNKPGRALGILLAGCGLIAAGEHLANPLAAAFEPTIQIVGLFIAFLVILRTPGSAIGRLLEWAPVVRFGVLSYSFYLFHGVILEAVDQNTQLSTVPAAVLAFIVTLAICEVVNRVVEQPLSQLRRRLSHQRRQRDAPLSGAAAE